MTYELILIDADGTIFDYDRAESEAFTQTMTAFGFEKSCSTLLPLYREINAFIWKEFEQGLLTIADIRRIRFERLAKKARIEYPTIEVSSQYLEHLSSMAFLYEDAEVLLQWLSERFTVVLITNGIASVQHQRIAKSGLAHLFNHVVISEEVGAAKPDPAIFESAFKTAHFTAKDTAIIIGDSLSSDILGGINFGIDTCWFNPARLENDGEIIPTYEISNLLEIKSLPGMA